MSALPTLLLIVMQCFFVAGSSNTKKIDGSRKSRIVFSQESKMYLNGNTNINTYSCDCNMPAGDIPLFFESRLAKVSFKNSILVIEARSIDCHHNLYNRNIKKALEADQFPEIKVEMLEAWQTTCATLPEKYIWFDVQSKTIITIRDVTLKQNVSASAMRTGDNTYRIKGNKLLHMNDFKVRMPKFMLGLIRINDEIIFNFDLVFEIQN
jgi:hypothetical protein